MDGVLVVDKPAGVTSHDVVDEVRRRLRTRRVGHAGTLDPDATGLLVVGVGRATRLLEYAQGGAKGYRATIVFGTATTTQDASGDPVERRPAAELERAAVEAALAGFVGDIDQVPPMVSALKVAGERLYAKARRGEEVERRPRRVTVHSVELLDWAPGPEPRATVEVVCSPGTYVRTLAHDLGARLGTGAHLSALRRTSSSGFTEDEAVPLDEVGPGALRPPSDALRGMARLEADPATARLVRNGRPLPGRAEVSEGDRVAIVAEGTLLAVYARRADELVAERVVAP
jgi:tRNA pseudouridine55 synthase